MNISRSDLVDSPKTEELKKVTRELFQRIESSDLYLAFRLLPEKKKVELQSDILAAEKSIYNYKTHGHTPSQYPKVVCWDASASGRKAKIN